MRVWDAPTRLFHWAIVLLLVVSYVSIKADYFNLHLWSGYTMLTLLLFRLIWGFVGSDTARFRNFLGNPVTAAAHLAQFPRRELDREIGHNAAGGWMVLVMLITIGVQVGTGLFAGDPVDGGGPFVDQISSSTQKWLDRVHAANINVIFVLVGLHVVAIALYAVVKRHNLVGAMITGKKRLPADSRQPRFTSPALAGAVLLAVAVLVWAVIRFG